MSNTWGAVAQGSNGSFHYVWGYADGARAQQDAMGRCEQNYAARNPGGTCAIVATPNLQFVEMAQGDDGQYYTIVNYSQENGRKRAVKTCAKKTKNCQIVFQFHGVYGPMDKNKTDDLP